MPPFEAFQRVRHFGSLDGIRAIAVALVVLHHSGVDTGPFASPGNTGVSLFFVLSGFLITTLLLRERDKTGTISLRNFVARRSLRIFPLYYAVLAVYTMLVALTDQGEAGRQFWHNLPYYATYTSNWFVDLPMVLGVAPRVIFYFAWSLASEEQFYLVWPATLKFLGQRRAMALLGLAVIVTAAVAWLAGPLDEPHTAGERIARIVTSLRPEICLGVMLAGILHSPRGFAAVYSVLGRWWSAPVFTLGAALGALAPWPAFPGSAVAEAALFTAFLGSCVVREDHPLARLLHVRLLVRLGVVSYGVYLMHQLALNVSDRVLAKGHIEEPWLQFAAGLVLVYLIAEVSFRIFESRFLKMKRRFEVVPTTVPESPAAPQVMDRSGDAQRP